MAQGDTWEAGTYELVVDRFDQRVSPLDKPFAARRYGRGDKVELDAEHADRLGRAGAIVKPGERERQNALAARLQYEQALAALPPALREEILGKRDPEEALAAASEKAGGDQGTAEGAKSPDPGTATSTPSGETSGGDLVTGTVAQKPAKSAKREVWAAYAVQRGAREEDVKDVGRDELVGRYGGDDAPTNAQV
jgi:hypothetical protein